MSFKTYNITADDADTRLDRWFRRNVGEMQQSLLQKFMRKGAIKVSGKKQEGSYRLKEGDEVVVMDVVIAETENPSKESQPKVHNKNTENWAKQIRESILHKDEDVIVINKPSGLAVQGGSGISVSVDDLLDYLKFDSKEKPKLVHRIDKDTSGILLLARNLKSAAFLTHAFRTKDVEKTYWALVCGVPSPRQGEINLKMIKKNIAKEEEEFSYYGGRNKHGDRPKERSRGGEKAFEKVVEDEENGKESVTRYQVIETIGKNFSVLELTPLTGRTHQLRVHTAYLGNPIWGDSKYGERSGDLKNLEIVNKLHLHARRISFTGRNGKKITITAPLTGHMKKTWKTLEIDE